MFQRSIKPLKSNSFFMFGARGTGKSTLLRQEFAEADTLWVDLLLPEVEERFALHPESLVAELRARLKPPEWIVIDEVQKQPKLLDVVHHCIERYQQKFALTGSSARKLKYGHANLLAGRAFVYELYPLTHIELGKAFSLDEALLWGTLPAIFKLDGTLQKQEYLRSYARTYLKEEIWAEHIVRKLDPFRKFLEVAAQCNAEPLNHSNIGRDVGVDSKTIQGYFQILEDTLLGFILEPYHRSIRKRQSHRPKFYFFDTGVQRALGRSLTVEAPSRGYAYGRSFEHFVVIEAHRLRQYKRNDYQFSYLRTKDQVEIDLIIERPGAPIALVEIKSALQVEESHVSKLQRIASDFGRADVFCWSRDPNPKRFGKVVSLPWQQGLSDVGLT